MKTLQLSTIVLLLASVFYSCTKTDLAETKTPGVADAQGSDKATATIVNFDINPKPAYVSSTVEITGTLQFSRGVNKFKVTLEKSTEKNVAGEWINFVATAHQEEVDLGTTGTGSNKKNNTATTFPFKYSFPAAEQGVSTTGWRVHVTGGDVHNGWVGNATLEIVEPCVETFTVTPNVEAKDLLNGTYEFTITYNLTSPADLENIHFQGGATSGGQFKHELVDGSLKGGLQVRHHNNQNTVLYYDGPLTKCQPLELSFKYIRKFSCPAEAATVTGEWTATSVGMEPYIVAPLTYSCNPDGTKK